MNQKSHQRNTKLSKATLHTTFAHLKKFFEWLAREPGYKSRIHYSDAEYFNSSAKDMRVATARREQKAPTLAQIKRVISQMPANTEIEQRDRAIIAFTLLTGARDGAIASAKLKHINLPEDSFFQDGRDVKTKFSKTFTSFFFPVGDEIRQIVVKWITYLTEEKLWSNDDPLFPMTNIAVGKNHRFEACGLKREHWSTASPIRDMFRKAFNYAGLPYFKPHSFRTTLVQLGQSICQNPEVFKAWSQNLGHESVLTTFRSYGDVPSQRQAAILKDLRTPSQFKPTEKYELADEIVRVLRDPELRKKLSASS